MDEYLTRAKSGHVCDLVSRFPSISPSELNPRADLMQRLENFRAPYLEEKLRSTGEMVSSEEYHEAFGEFKKYAFLSTVVDEPLAMTSPKVDKVWHQFILFTKSYRGFCEELLGEFMHHTPTTSYTPTDKASITRFIDAYKTHFGDIPEIWNLQKNPESDSCASCASACGGGCSG